jgi:hypothetical protein
MDIEGRLADFTEKNVVVAHHELVTWETHGRTPVTTSS